MGALKMAVAILAAVPRNEKPRTTFRGRSRRRPMATDILLAD
jgi:hypothetical protein